MEFSAFSTEQLFTEISTNKIHYFDGSEGRKKEIFSKRLSEKLIEIDASIGSRNSQLSNFCKAGCTHCCSHLFQLMSTEATAIAFYLLNNEEILRGFINNFLEIQINHPNKSALREECTPPDRKQTPADCIKYFKQKIPCDFLIKGQCIIYETRPLICSAYISLAPARLCSFEPKAHIPLEIRKEYFESRIWFEIQARGRYKNKPEFITNWSQHIIECLLTGNF